MANLSSWIGTKAHTALLVGGGMDAASHIAGGALANVGVGAASSMYYGGDPLNNITGNALQGALIGAGTRYASARYSEGAFRSTFANHVGHSTEALAKRNNSLSAQSHNFSMNNFTQGVNPSYWNVNDTAMNNLTSSSFMSKYRG